MLAILSPAKDMTFELGNYPEEIITKQPKFLDRSLKLVKTMRQFDASALGNLMKISHPLAVLNVDRFHNWDQDHHEKNACPAAFAFTGEAYRGLRTRDFSLEQLGWMQHSLRILSGLYGVLEPFDLIQAYRLEMGTHQSFGTSMNLYEFWKSTATKALEVAVKSSIGDQVLINLASKEYFSVVDFNKFKYPVITPNFYQEKGGERKIVSVYAKRARGMMVRFMIENRIETVSDLTAFDSDGYYFDNNHSTENQWIFVR